MDKSHGLHAHPFLESHRAILNVKNLELVIGLHIDAYGEDNTCCYLLFVYLLPVLNC